MAAGRVDARGVIVTCPSCGHKNRLPFTPMTKQIPCANCKTILAEIDKKADAKRKRALELLFFYLLHEPVDNANDAAKPPAVPEKKSLLLRLNMTARPGYGESVVGDFFMHELVHKLDIKFFGLLFTDIRGQLAGAYADAKTICDQLQTTGRDA